MTPGRSIPDPGFAGDTGVGDPALLTALQAYARDPGRAPEVVWALASARVFVAVVAILRAAEEPVAGLRREKSSDMALVTVQREDGARAVPAFSSLGTLARWRPDARPVPVEAARAALSAAAEGAVALVLDFAGPVTLVVAGGELRALAEGDVRPPVYADPVVGALVRDLAAGSPGIAGVRLEPAPGSDARLVVGLHPGADARHALAFVAELRDRAELRARTFAGLEVVVSPAGE